MGKNYSRQLVDQTQTIVSSAVTNIMNTLSNRSSYNYNNRQQIGIDWTGADFNHCPIEIGQRADITSSVLFNNILQLQTDVETEINDQLETLVNQTLTQINSSIPVFDENEAEARVKINQAVKQEIRVSLGSAIENVLTVNAGNTQQLDLVARYFKCKNSRITIDQAVTIDAVANSTASSTIENIVKNSEVAAVKATIDQEVSQANKGIDIAFIIFMVIVAIIVALFLFSKTVTGATGKFMTNVKDFFKSTAGKWTLGVLGVITVGTIVSYALIRSGTVKNPFVSEVAQ